jgi:hypothetical protein
MSDDADGPARTPRPRSVRLTVDLPPEDHAKLGRWCMEVAVQLDRGKISQADVIRVLLQRLHTDPELGEQVIAALADRRRHAH